MAQTSTTPRGMRNMQENKNNRAGDQKPYERMEKHPTTLELISLIISTWALVIAFTKGS